MWTNQTNQFFTITYSKHHVRRAAGMTCQLSVCACYVITILHWGLHLSHKLSHKINTKPHLKKHNLACCLTTLTAVRRHFSSPERLLRMLSLFLSLGRDGSRKCNCKSISLLILLLRLITETDSFLCVCSRCTVWACFVPVLGF